MEQQLVFIYQKLESLETKLDKQLKVYQEKQISLEEDIQAELNNLSISLFKSQDKVKQNSKKKTEQKESKAQQSKKDQKETKL
ncbi:hypothetical protein TTHERM_00273370 (macronuclear) [Tetrahymena thermophila SB210]|uniref:Uncharacterized protein n=1 Tax=Tetrahymena thermophila (strain SB210) TaxID=312017 RepID=I7MJ22_TETTS|nr:hypothetical protein TTHERM_00273370 [Tetrahymena thermophila SB210]EAR95731.2 hypothetical protein TTHERM_00273370 [Tetrahymena thermophila SB210]|eukprot:XP_001015976.2 hypothetical protein TTHERM_00273370 [Tetrahymena thermophila SB210]